MIEAFENFRIKMANKYGDAWIEKMNKSEEDAYIKAKAIIDTYEDIVTQNCVSKESTNDDYVTERITDEIEADLKKINDEIDKIDIEKTKVIRKFAQKYNIEYSHFTDIGKLKGKLTENERAELDKYNKHISELSNKSNKFMTEIMTIIRNDKSKRINPENPRRRLW